MVEPCADVTAGRGLVQDHTKSRHWRRAAAGDTGTLSEAKLVLMFLLAWALIAVLVFASGGSARLPAELAQRLGAVAADWHFAVALPAVAGWLTLAVFVEPDRWSQGLPVLPHLAKILRPPLSGLRNT